LKSQIITITLSFSFRNGITYHSEDLFSLLKEKLKKKKNYVSLIFDKLRKTPLIQLETSKCKGGKKATKQITKGIRILQTNCTESVNLFTPGE